ncbi:penicillin-binding protein 2 [Streptomyces sp. A7024]|uniref:Penicillin-binding protein 2 n=1 Tax=Streptomyces coryli TaxID=1128680 RepID=A0A6G4U4M5_9ACTN|nr:penicillin-binding protein 2 [Streptomyces coryli]NGN66328.1 penicillin-binding protein 2 [Streptomyces coryli]
MIRCTRHTAAFSLLLLLALLAGAGRVQVVQSASYDDNPGNRRTQIARWSQPRGDIYIGDRKVTGSTDTRQDLRYERSYTAGDLYAPVTGHASQGYGATGLESAEDDLLSGADDRLAPFPFWHEITRSLRPPGDVHTTIDRDLQRIAYDRLAGRKGAVVALQPRTGRILALVSTPSYDPQQLSSNGRDTTAAWRRLTRDDDQPLLNRAIRQTYPPGSAFKVVTAAAALENGVVGDIDAPTRTPSPYRLTGSNTLLRNASGGCADASLRDAFAASCNTVFAKLGAEVGGEAMAATARAFGFNAGEDELRLPSPALPSVFATRQDAAQVSLSAIGQYETRATPLQMAEVAAAVANGGQRMRPYLVERVTDGDGDTVGVTRPEVAGSAMRPMTAQLLQQMMVDVVERGTGKRAAIKGAVVGGKTGTAQHGVENSAIPYAWFISWAKSGGAASAADVAVAVVVEDAEAHRADVSGGGSAAPIAREVMKAALD